MFEATILIVTIMGGAKVLQDSYGPYPTEEACLERVKQGEEVLPQTVAHMGLVSVKGKCTIVDDGISI